MRNLIDKFGRVHDYLRLSITDKCNFNCFYCNPKNSIDSKHTKNNLLSYEEILRIINIFASKYNFKKFRFTGGEPLLRKGFIDFLKDVYQLKTKFGFEMHLTTNGFLLNEYLSQLKLYGIDRINISLDTLRKDVFKKITGQDAFDEVMIAINSAKKMGFDPLKINTVIIKGVNDNEIFDFVEFAKNLSINVRFIEYMPFSANNWDDENFLSYKDIKEIVEKKYKLIPLNNGDNSVAKNFRVMHTNCYLSFISSISEHFCSNCNRVRINSKGEFRLCLFSNDKSNINFKELFISGFSDDQIAEIIDSAILDKWEKHPSAYQLKEIKSNNMLSIGG